MKSVILVMLLMQPILSCPPCIEIYRPEEERSTITCTNISTTNIPYNYYNAQSYQQVIKIVDSSIATIPPMTLARFSTIKLLHLSRLNIQKLLPGAFDGLISLEYLYLDGNELKVINRGVFNSLYQLQLLDLSNNNIQQLSPQSLKDVTNLKWLDLANNKIPRLESGIFHDLPQLTELKLNDNLLTEFKDCDLWGNSTVCLNDIPIDNNLTLINLQNNAINSFVVLNCRKLETLRLDNNNISMLETGCFDGLEQLEMLNLTNNNIARFQFDVLEIEDSLKELYLDNNQLSSVEDLEVSLGNLTVISLENNNFLCDQLAAIYDYLKAEEVVLRKGGTFDSGNFNGISCKNP